MDVFWQKEGQTESQKPPWTEPSKQKAPDKNSRNLGQTPCIDICMYACTTENGGGSEMCDEL